ncbi:hypothetical protein F2Q69_00017177 [Brassica cretica]|uniref:Uncharacterized protein n=1 Tax=Brassica cretica TaxID=69181 RepID=A0A8S9R8Z3_BRACR|nr:hypothetical protein F2Q69_00017177 [Brassica cretica]
MMDLFFFVCVDVNVKNNGGRNALRYAASKGWLEIAQLYFKSDELINKKPQVIQEYESRKARMVRPVSTLFLLSPLVSSK